MTTAPEQSTQLSLSNFSVFKSDLIQGRELRVLGTPENPLFIAKDIAEMLGYKDTRKAIEAHVDKEDILTCNDTEESRRGDSPLRKIQAHTKVINESGFYSLLLRSKLYP